MSVILDFSENEKNSFISKCIKYPIIGYDSEAKCYLINNYVYKIYNSYEEIHNMNNTICRDDLNLSSFIFPEEIYTCHNKIFAYKTRYIKQNTFTLDSLIDKSFDYEEYDIAIPLFINDLYILSRNNICTCGLGLNTLFDGNRIYAIDTLSYKLTDDNPLKKNIISLKSGLDFLYESFEDYLMDSDVDEFDYFDDELEKVNNLIEDIKGTIDSFAFMTELVLKDKEVPKIKRL